MYLCKTNTIEMDLHKKIRKELREALNNSERPGSPEYDKVYEYIYRYECAIISAYRYDLTNSINDEDNTGEVLTPEQNRARNELLSTMLTNMGYDYTKVDGAFIENYETPEAREVTEEAFFVANIKNDPSFNMNMVKLSEKFGQDGVMLLYDFGKKVVLRGTNNAKWPGYRNVVNLGSFHEGEHEFMTKVNGKAFHFK